MINPWGHVNLMKSFYTFDDVQSIKLAQWFSSLVGVAVLHDLSRDDFRIEVTAKCDNDSFGTVVCVWFQVDKLLQGGNPWIVYTRLSIREKEVRADDFARHVRIVCNTLFFTLKNN